MATPSLLALRRTSGHDTYRERHRELVRYCTDRQVLTGNMPVQFGWPIIGVFMGQLLLLFYWTGRGYEYAGNGTSRYCFDHTEKPPARNKAELAELLQTVCLRYNINLKKRKAAPETSSDDMEDI